MAFLFVRKEAEVHIIKDLECFVFPFPKALVEIVKFFMSGFRSLAVIWEGFFDVNGKITHYNLT